jgi:hypothetical protein
MAGFTLLASFMFILLSAWTIYVPPTEHHQQINPTDTIQVSVIDI